MAKYQVGKIINVHGLKGDLKVYPTTEDINRFELLDKVYIDEIEYEVENVRYHKGNVLLKVSGIDDINEAEKLKNKSVMIPEDMALELDENEYYIRDLYDMEVYDEDGEKIGILTEIYFTKSNDVYEVTMKDGKKILLPNIDECIKEVDVEAKKMTVKIMEGLI